jgi:guanylate kinase
MPDLERSVSWTTRPPRPGEKEGVDYRFIDEKTFREMVREDRFFEWEEVHGSFYGTPREPLLQRRREGKDTVFDIDTRGALNLKQAFPESCLVFLLPPSLAVLEERLRRRRTEEEVSLKRRMENARREIAEKDKFDYVIINDDLDRAYEKLREIVFKEKRVNDKA